MRTYPNFVSYHIRLLLTRMLHGFSFENCGNSRVDNSKSTTPGLLNPGSPSADGSFSSCLLNAIHLLGLLLVILSTTNVWNSIWNCCLVVPLANICATPLTFGPWFDPIPKTFVSQLCLGSSNNRMAFSEIKESVAAGSIIAFKGTHFPLPLLINSTTVPRTAWPESPPATDVVFATAIFCGSFFLSRCSISWCMNSHRLHFPFCSSLFPLKQAQVSFFLSKQFWHTLNFFWTVSHRSFNGNFLKPLHWLKEWLSFSHIGHLRELSLLEEVTWAWTLSFFSFFGLPDAPAFKSFDRVLTNSFNCWKVGISLAFKPFAWFNCVLVVASHCKYNNPANNASFAALPITPSFFFLKTWLSLSLAVTSLNNCSVTIPSTFDFTCSMSSTIFDRWSANEPRPCCAGVSISFLNSCTIRILGEL